MKIVLINPRLRIWSPNIWVPLGLTYVAAVLERDGHTITIIDMNEKKIKIDDLCSYLSNDVDLIGITGMITECQKILKIIDISKKTHPDRPLMLGGPLATTFPKQLLEQSEADFIVIGEGEKTVPSLMKGIENGLDLSKINAIAYKKDGQVIINEASKPIENLDTIPFPARHLLDMNKYIKNHFKSFGLNLEGFDDIRSTNLSTSRGCPYNCIFCYKDVWGNKWRGRSAQNIIEEMDFLYEKYRINGFLFVDDTFVLDRKRIFEFTNLLKKSKKDYVWYCNGRVNLMQKDMLKSMREAGCVGIAYGIESGDQSTLDFMRKGITIDQTKEVVKWTKESGINVAGYFMIGMLGETKNTIYNTINFAKELDLNFYGFSITTPMPGTELYECARKEGLIKEDISSFNGWDFDMNINLTKDCTDDELRAFKYETFKKFSLEKEFGRYFMLNPIFLKNVLKVIFSLRDKEELKEFVINVNGILKKQLKNKKSKQ